MPARDVIDVWQVSAGDRSRGEAAMRAVLGSYLAADPATLLFQAGPHGKPALAGHALHFSFSRSGSRALVAVSRERPVGIDLERVKPRRAVERVARRRFAGDEAAALARLAEPGRTTAFHRCWTGKEAYAKGLGTGLSLGLGSFSVAGLAEGRARCTVGGWDVAAVPAPAGHVAALAAPGSAWRVRVHGGLR